MNSNTETSLLPKIINFKIKSIELPDGRVISIGDKVKFHGIITGIEINKYFDGGLVFRINEDILMSSCILNLE